MSNPEEFVTEFACPNKRCGAELRLRLRNHNGLGQATCPRCKQQFDFSVPLSVMSAHWKKQRALVAEKARAETQRRIAAVCY